MKTKSFFSLIGLTIAGALCFAGAKSHNGLVVHEWGTFTSLQAGDGIPLSWVPKTTAELPKFVYDWSHAGFDRAGNSGFNFGKGEMITMQRMETPVVYFYSDREQTVDLTVKFPKGKITEWYPQTRDLGPCIITNKTAPDQKPQYVRESFIRWPNFKVLPAATHAEMARSIPLEKSGSHYFAARETDSDYLQTGGPNPETEKFLFYRGVGNFTTPLRLTMESMNTVTVENTSKEPLQSLFVLNITATSGQYLAIPQLKPHEKKSIPLGSGTPIQSIQTEMAAALVAQGLYQKEASAMVHTWGDSWFAEQGIRVLYLLPRKWTDATLAMDIKPRPRELVRVMVGRSELIPQKVERDLSEQLAKFDARDAAAAERIRVMMKSLGRFGDAVLQRALYRMPGDAKKRNDLVAAVYSTLQTN